MPTRYKDILFRSKLEADWALTLDTLGIPWDYEPEGRYWGKTYYAPDFWLPDSCQWFEVKGAWDEAAEKKAQALLANWDRPRTTPSGGFTKFSPAYLIGSPKGRFIGLSRETAPPLANIPVWPVGLYQCTTCGIRRFLFRLHDGFSVSHTCNERSRFALLFGEEVSPFPLVTRDSVG